MWMRHCRLLGVQLTRSPVSSNYVHRLMQDGFERSTSCVTNGRSFNTRHYNRQLEDIVLNRTVQFHTDDIIFAIFIFSVYVQRKFWLSLKSMRRLATKIRCFCCLWVMTCVSVTFSTYLLTSLVMHHASCNLRQFWMTCDYHFSYDLLFQLFKFATYGIFRYFPALAAWRAGVCAPRVALSNLVWNSVHALCRQ